MHETEIGVRFIFIKTSIFCQSSDNSSAGAHRAVGQLAIGKCVAPGSARGRPVNFMLALYSSPGRAGS